MPKNVAYLLGAGASVPGMPVTAHIPSRIEQQSNWFKKIVGGNNSQSRHGIPYSTILERYLSNLHELLQVNDEHGTVDTLARKLFLRGDAASLSKYHELKATLCLFFTLEQLRNPRKLRYESFLSALLKENPNHPPVFPSHVKVLTWNYDQLFGASLATFFKFEVLKDVHEHYGITTYSRIQGTRDYSILHLNGLAGVDLPDGPSPVTLTPELTLSNGHTEWPYLLDVLHSMYSDSSRIALTFSWESPLTEEKREIIKRFVGDTSVLVVIGYSFPFFNRELDRAILGQMPLENVYLQSTSSSLANMRIAFEAIAPRVPENKIKLIDDENSFYLPPQL